MSLTIKDFKKELANSTKPRWYVNCADFANMVKAFIGANYLSIAFAFSQSGILLGAIAMFLIAFLTDHCCHLIVKTKYHAIDKLITNHKLTQQSIPNGRRNIRNSIVVKRSDYHGLGNHNDECSAVLEHVNEDNVCTETKEDTDLRESITKHMTYGDVGKLCFGSKGLGIVNFFIALTQFGFCVNYYIFIGNTIHSLFPVHYCYKNSTGTQLCSETDVNRINASSSLNQSFKFSNPLQIDGDWSDFHNFALTVPNVLVHKSSSLNITMVTSSEPNQYIREVIDKAPDLRILVVSPMLIFIMFALIRSVRYLGAVSVLANISIFFGWIAVFWFLVNDFKIQSTVKYINWKGLPIFFGMVTGAFEGIGLVIPIESSMVGNRHLFPWFLHGAVLVLTVILGLFGSLGYLMYGSAIQQMLNTNIPSGNATYIIVNVGICIGIVLTFPLQIFPVIEILEKYLFTEGHIFGARKKSVQSEDDVLVAQDNEPLLGNEDVVASISESVPAWKRNILRVSIVVVAGGLAILLRDYFAYVSAFIGAVGSSVLAYILPCLFHLKMCFKDINVFIKTKDIFIIIFGIFASIVSIVSVIESIF